MVIKQNNVNRSDYNHGQFVTSSFFPKLFKEKVTKMEAKTKIMKYSIWSVTTYYEHNSLYVCSLVDELFDLSSF